MTALWPISTATRGAVNRPAARLLVLLHARRPVPLWRGQLVPPGRRAPQDPQAPLGRRVSQVPRGLPDCPARQARPGHRGLPGRRGPPDQLVPRASRDLTVPQAPLALPAQLEPLDQPDPLALLVQRALPGPPDQPDPLAQPALPGPLDQPDPLVPPDRPGQPAPQAPTVMPRPFASAQ